MARKEVTQYFDDVTGEVLDNSEVTTVDFSYKGSHYVIDLSEENAKKFDEEIQEWIKHAHRVARHSDSFKAKKPTRRDYPLVRKWLRDNNMVVSDKGRIPKHLLDMYDNRDA